MSLKDSISSFSGVVVKSYASLSVEERKQIAHCDSLLESITLLRSLLGRNQKTPGFLAQDKLFCEELRGAFLMGRLR